MNKLNFNYKKFLHSEKFHYFLEVYNMLTPQKQKVLILKAIIKKITFRSILQWFFSLKNSDDKEYKIITILGFKFYKKRNQSGIDQQAA